MQNGKSGAEINWKLDRAPGSTIPFFRYTIPFLVFTSWEYYPIIALQGLQIPAHEAGFPFMNLCELISISGDSVLGVGRYLGGIRCVRLFLILSLKNSPDRPPSPHPTFLFSFFSFLFFFFFFFALVLYCAVGTTTPALCCFHVSRLTRLITPASHHHYIRSPRIPAFSLFKHFISASLPRHGFHSPRAPP